MRTERGKQFFEVGHNDIQAFINKLVGNGCSYLVIRKAYLALNACYKYAIMKEDTLLGA